MLRAHDLRPLPHGRDLWRSSSLFFAVTRLFSVDSLLIPHRSVLPSVARSQFCFSTRLPEVVCTAFLWQGSSSNRFFRVRAQDCGYVYLIIFDYIQSFHICDLFVIFSLECRQSAHSIAPLLNPPPFQASSVVTHTARTTRVFIGVNAPSAS